MTWRDSMGPASFRGAPFFVSSSERAGGRRVVTHEFPGRSAPYQEDMGGKVRTFPVEGYVLGADYMSARDALLSALETEGPGTLAHPYYGTLSVVVTSYRVRETSEDGGYAAFSVEFSEAPAALPAPTVTPDTGAAVLTSAAAVKAASQAEFTDSYDASAPYLGEVATALGNAASAVETAARAASLPTQEAAALRRRVDRIRDAAATLVNAPADLLAALSGLFDSAPVGALAVYGFDPGPRPPAVTSNRLVEQANFDALQLLVQRLAVVRAAELLPAQAFDNYGAALSAREAVADKLDELSETAGDDTFAALVQLRADLVRAVPGAESDLPRLVTYTPPVTLPSLVLAHNLYGSVALEGDIIRRNVLPHPGFVLGGTALEVLTDD